MLNWLRSMTNAILGKVPGKPDRLDAATRMGMDADFSPRGAADASQTVRRKGEATFEKPPDALDELQRLVKR